MAGRSGRWFIEAADIAFPDDVPTLSNRMLLLPLGHGLYETHAVGPTGQQVLFSFTPAGTTDVPGLALYRCSATDFYSGLVAVEQDLEDHDTHWYEHGQFMLNGAHFFFMGSRGSDFYPWGNLQSEVFRISNSTPPTGPATQVTRTMSPADGTYRPNVAHPVCGDMSFRDNDAVYVYIFHNGPDEDEYAGRKTRPGEIVLVTCA